MTNSYFSNISQEAKDLIKHLLTVDYNMRFDFDKVLKHIWFDKDTIMKQNVKNLISKVSINLTSNNLPLYNKENNTKKIKFCSCITHASTSDSE